MNLKLENIFLFSRILCDIESNVGQMFLKNGYLSDQVRYNWEDDI